MSLKYEDKYEVRCAGESWMRATATGSVALANNLHEQRKVKAEVYHVGTDTPMFVVGGDPIQKEGSD